MGNATGERNEAEFIDTIMAIKPDNDDSHLRELATLFGPLRRQIGQLLYKPSFRNFMTSLI